MTLTLLLALVVLSALALLLALVAVLGLVDWMDREERRRGSEEYVSPGWLRRERGRAP